MLINWGNEKVIERLERINGEGNLFIIDINRNGNGSNKTSTGRLIFYTRKNCTSYNEGDD